MINDIYKKSFEVFLSRTDEKKVIEKFIKDTIKDSTVNSILEIGAGRGDILDGLKTVTTNLVAIEPNTLFQSTLKDKGLMS